MTWKCKKENPDPTAVATAKLLESFVLKVIRNETDKGVSLEEMSEKTQDKKEIDKWYSIRWNGIYITQKWIDQFLSSLQIMKKKLQ